MSLQIGDEAPNFKAETTQGPIEFHQWLGQQWAILFSHPKDFTPVCTTELGALAKLRTDFEKRGCKVLGLSVDSVSEHRRWIPDIEETQNCVITYPIIADTDLLVAKLYGMLHASATGSSGRRTSLDNFTVRSVFLIGPDKRIKMTMVYPMNSGRDFTEILRVLDSCQLTEKFGVATPVNWRPGQDVIIPPSITDQVAQSKFPAGWKTLRPYLRVMPQPK